MFLMAPVLSGSFKYWQKQNVRVNKRITNCASSSQWQLHNCKPVDYGERSGGNVNVNWFGGVRLTTDRWISLVFILP